MKLGTENGEGLGSDFVVYKTEHFINIITRRLLSLKLILDFNFLKTR